MTPAGLARLLNWTGTVVKPRPLVDGRHETRAPVARAIGWRRVAVGQHHKRRQILVLGAQAIGRPAPNDGRPAKTDPVFIWQTPPE